MVSSGLLIDVVGSGGVTARSARHYDDSQKGWWRSDSAGQTVDKTVTGTSMRYQLETDVRLAGVLRLILRGIYHDGLATNIGNSKSKQ